MGDQLRAVVVNRSEVGESRKRIAIEPVHGPIVHRPGTDAPIESDRGLVPVEDPPFHAATATFDRYPGEMGEEAPADSATAICGEDEQVLQIEPAPAKKRREVVEEEREARDVGPDVREHDLRCWPVAKQRLVDALLGRLDLVCESLVIGEALDEREDYRRVLLGRRHDANIE